MERLTRQCVPVSSFEPVKTSTLFSNGTKVKKYDDNGRKSRPASKVLKMRRSHQWVIYSSRTRRAPQRSIEDAAQTFSLPTTGGARSLGAEGSLWLKIRREFYGGLTPGAVSGRVSCRLRPSASTSDQTSTMRPQAMRNIFMPVQVAVRLVGFKSPSGP